MAFPRLAASAKDFTYSGTVNKRARPYFEVWYQNEKTVGESPEDFIFRILKTGAINFHIQANIKIEQDAAEQAKLDVEVAINADIQLMAAEVE